VSIRVRLFWYGLTRFMIISLGRSAGKPRVLVYFGILGHRKHNLNLSSTLSSHSHQASSELRSSKHRSHLFYAPSDMRCPGNS